ncbi:putative serine esterase-domain-containing protein [Kockovaella imperatae]|uniref:Putative serine esterase-domain-containing protein n=1 Tax=Kockovaella imperatae TaxID=4999 RepID=A0A1Y1U8Q8_9TREE|nr:putative serine esterase-domain-containing protein [Kockovaella imperatae]ORX34429.1 putative serine esterase-domain-containing protein [Kockovaella imperatae]
MASTLTYDGVDVNASRVAWEVDEKISELEALGTKVTRFSVLGYSLGGVIARYLVGLLHSRSPSFFEAHRPVSFTTVACPHLGIPAYNSYFSTALIFLGSRLLARTGSQLYVRDRYSDEDPRPLLEIMADPTKVFHKALDQFKHVQVFANGTRDFTVPYPSAAIEDSDPFIEWEAQGLVVESNESGLVESWRYPDDQEALKMTQSKKSGWTNPMDKLPPVLKDRFRYNPALLIVFPIAMPVILVLMIFRLSMDSRRSSNRIALLKTPKSLEGATPNRHGWSIEHLRDTIGRFEQSMETDLIEEADPPGQMRRRSRRSSAPHRPPNGSAKTRPTQMDGPEKLELPSQRVQFTPAQQNMLRGLRRIKIDRFVTWYPDIGNSHAVSICRDPKNKPVHNKGRGLLKVWAESLIRDDAEE